jgi:hypothetical protein
MALIGCGADGPTPKLFAIQPNQAYSNQDVRVLLVGSGLLPSFRINPDTDERVAIMDGFSGRIGMDPFWAPLTHFDWLGPEQISATLPGQDAEELVRTPPICPCDVEITDPRGRKAVKPKAFTELGPDKDAPTIVWESPVAGKRYCAGGIIHARCIVDDPSPGYLTDVVWSLNGGVDEDLPIGRCPFEVGASHVECAFDVPIEIDKGFDPNDTVYLFVRATDNANNARSSATAVVLSEPPKINVVDPSGGPTAGGTDVIIIGSGFESDSLTYFDDKLLYPDGGKVSKDGTIISGYAPAHAAGEVTVRVVSRLGEVLMPRAFEYKDLPTGGGL